MKLIEVLFGSGWWIPWHVFIVGSFVPMLLLLRRVRRTEPGEGAPGGGFAYLALLGIAFALAFATVVDGTLLGWRIARLHGAAWGMIGGLSFMMLWTATLFGIAKRLSVPREESEITVLPATLTFAVWHAGIIAANLVALRKANG
ncbi:MAG: hypothetical protein HYU52_14615 [Acidobacteria bacterium]|nr:hypothetical protein [Acidobacteriota bacterium]